MFDLQTIFGDVLETKQQRERRLLAEDLAQSPQLGSGLFQAFNPAAQAISLNLSQSGVSPNVTFLPLYDLEISCAFKIIEQISII